MKGLNFIINFFKKEIPLELNKKSSISLLTNFLEYLDNNNIIINPSMYKETLTVSCPDIEKLIFRLNLIKESIDEGSKLKPSGNMSSMKLVDFFTNDSNYLFDTEEAIGILRVLAKDTLASLESLEDYNYSYYNRIILNDIVSLHNLTRIGM